MWGGRNAISGITACWPPCAELRQAPAPPCGVLGLPPLFNVVGGFVLAPDRCLAMFRRKESSLMGELTIELGAVLLLALGLQGPGQDPTAQQTAQRVWRPWPWPWRWSPLRGPTRGWKGLAWMLGGPGGRRRLGALLCLPGSPSTSIARNRRPVQRLAAASPPCWSPLGAMQLPAASRCWVRSRCWCPGAGGGRQTAASGSLGGGWASSRNGSARSPRWTLPSAAPSAMHILIGGGLPDLAARFVLTGFHAGAGAPAHVSCRWLWLALRG